MKHHLEVEMQRIGFLYVSMNGLGNVFQLLHLQGMSRAVIIIIIII
jgi:hypothetical protein